MKKLGTFVDACKMGVGDAYVVLDRLHKEAGKVQGCFFKSQYETCNKCSGFPFQYNSKSRYEKIGCGFKNIGATNANYRKFRNC